ncbi:MAG: rhodanese-like domain-containing protein [Bdellovibrio sp.]|nr:rhodanese-like domain-containing protein [Methylotenera sp.]
MNTAISAVETILNAAAQRAAAKGLTYAGELTPQEAFEALQHGAVTLVDVRSLAELELVGRVPNANNVEWAFYPGMVANAEFAAQLQAQVAQNKPIVFMCRTGGRSHNAAVVASQLGYTAYNMLDGFEGEANTQKQRTLINGWKHAGLPWSN